MADEIMSSDVKPKRGYYLLNTDASRKPSGVAAIGAVLRTRHLAAVDEISETIDAPTHNVAEYRALIEGLKLAHSHGIERIRVYMDSELVVEQMDRRAAVKQDHLKGLHDEARELCLEFASIRISWVPREWNAVADGLATKALLAS
jgi:ribonuclease HI